MNNVIKVENLSKKYIIMHEGKDRYITIRDIITNSAQNISLRLLHPFSSEEKQSDRKEDLWALKNISFEVNKGDRIGIIGKNGAGKSTLLKLLGRITEPTEGKISIKGRVSSLLEVGTGFHPELTGRENIFLNGAILGMSRTEINNKFQEIVDFAEVDKFLDTPVKRYSSGMQVRLAFAVAAHLEPEILLVDEVLAVGDAQFQKKCLGKMEEVSSDRGRTILFVSHNMNAIVQLCNRCIYLDKGSIIMNDYNVKEVVKYYLFGDTHQKKTEWINNGNEYNNSWFRPIRFGITDQNGINIEMPVSNNSDFWINIEGEIKSTDPALTIGYTIYSEDENLLYWSCHTDDWDENKLIINKGFYRISCQVPKNLLNEGTYRIELMGSLHFREWLFQPGVNAPDVYLQIQGGLSSSPYWMGKRPGLLAPILSWRIENI